MERRPLIRHPFFTSKTFFVIGTLVIVGLSVGVSREVVRRFRINHEIGRLEAAVEEVSAANQELAGLSEYFQSSYFQEREARLKLGLAKPGEQTVIVPEVAGATTESNGERQTEPRVIGVGQTEEEQSNPDRWWDYFFSVSTE